MPPQLESFLASLSLSLLAVIIIVGLIVLAFLSFAFKLCIHLTDRITPPVVDSLITSIREVFSHHTRRYHQHLIYAHRNLDVKGLTTQGIYTLALEHVFVELTFAPQPPHKTTPDPLRVLPEDLRTGQHLIWDFLAVPALKDQHFAIIGPPGSGKTTLLKHMTLALVALARTHRHTRIPSLFPILIFLRDLVPLLSTESPSPTGGGLRPDLLTRLCDTLVRCDAFESDRALRSFFIDARLVPWRDQLLSTGTRTERVRAVVDQLYDACTNQGDNALILLLKILTDSISPGDNLHHELSALARDLDSAPSTAAGSFSLPAAIVFTLRKHGLDSPPSEAWFTRHLARGCCLVMLDGLDEVADSTTRQRMVAWVQRQLNTYANNRFLITSRPHGYRTNPLGSVTILEVAPFDYTQINRFVHNWYLANEIMSQQRDDKGVHLDARKGAEDLLRRIQSASALTALAVNPLLLTMIATVHRYRSSLPGRRVELYAEICEVFLGKRKVAKGLTDDLNPARKRSLLQPIAFAMMERQQREIPRAAALAILAAPLALVAPGLDGDTFLHRIEADSGLFLERESGVFSFAHLTFQEYLASTHALESHLESKLVAHVADSWWHETLRLFAAQTDATSLIHACLDVVPIPIPALALALACLEEARAVQPEARAKLETLLRAGVEDPDPERRRLIAEALLTLRLQRLQRLSDAVFIDPTLITNAEYQLFLDEMHAEEKFYQPDHWSGFTFPAGQARVPVVGIRPSDAEAFCAWLTRGTLDATAWRFRLPTPAETAAAPLALPHWCVTGRHTAASTFTITHVPAHGILSPEQLERQLETDITSSRASILARASTFIRSLARDLARASDYANVFDFARDHTSGLALAGDLEFDFVDHASDLDLVLDRARACVSDLGFALAHAYDLDRTSDLDRAFASDLALARDLVCDIARAGVIANDITRDIAHARARDISSVRARDLDIASARDLILASASAHVRDLAGDLNHASGLALARTRALARDLAFARDFDLDLANALASNRDFVSDLDFAHITDRAGACATDRDRKFARISALNTAALLLATVQDTALALMERLGFDRDRAASRAAFQQAADAFLDLYLDLTILEARIRGELPAFEGIRIVKERIPPTKQPD